MIECKGDQPPANAQSSTSDSPGITALAPQFTPSEVVPTDRMASPGPRPPLFPEYSPRVVQTITASGFRNPTLLPYNNPTLDRTDSEDPFLSAILLNLASTESQIATFPTGQIMTPRGNYGHGSEPCVHSNEEEITGFGYSCFHLDTIPVSYRPNLGDSSSTTIPSRPTVIEPQIATFPMHWVRIPQERYSNGRHQHGFKPLESISFSTNGLVGINLVDALRKNFTGLDGRDDPMLQGGPGGISCRLSVGFSR